MSWEAEMDPPAEHPLLRRELGCLSDSMGPEKLRKIREKPREKLRNMVTWWF